MDQSESDLTTRMWPNWSLLRSERWVKPWMICGDPLTAEEMIGDEPNDLIAGCDVSGPGAGK